MFTGIIEGTGQIQEITPLQQGGARLQIGLPFANELTIGESVAVNGCCLTVTQRDEASAAFDLLQQTLNVTNLGDLKEGGLVNLERALRPDARLSGHLVQGHIDTTTRILSIESHGQDTRITLALPEAAQALLIPKGSIAIDGISLTVAELEAKHFSVWIIPHTLTVTNLGKRQAEERVNLEYDLLGKYVARQISLR